MQESEASQHLVSFLTCQPRQFYSQRPSSMPVKKLRRGLNTCGPISHLQIRTCSRPQTIVNQVASIVADTTGYIFLTFGPSATPYHAWIVYQTKQPLRWYNLGGYISSKQRKMERRVWQELLRRVPEAQRLDVNFIPANQPTNELNTSLVPLMHAYQLPLDITALPAMSEQRFTYVIPLLVAAWMQVLAADVLKTTQIVEPSKPSMGSIDDLL